MRNQNTHAAKRNLFVLHVVSGGESSMLPRRRASTIVIKTLEVVEGGRCPICREPSSGAQRRLCHAELPLWKKKILTSSCVLETYNCRKTQNNSLHLISLVKNCLMVCLEWERNPILEESIRNSPMFPFRNGPILVNVKNLAASVYLYHSMCICLLAMGCSILHLTAKI